MRHLLLFLHFLLLTLGDQGTGTKPEWPDRFTVFWNIPTQQCYTKYGIEMPLQEYGIVFNTDNYQGNNGNKVATLYEYDFGEIPLYKHHELAKEQHGGLPQLVNMPAHLAKVKRDVEKTFTDASFNGPLYIDIEEWRPMYHMNWWPKDVYKNETKKIIQARDPTITGETLEKQAAEEFNAGTKELLTKTIDLVRELRPNAIISMYGFPYCNWPGEYRVNKTNEGNMTCSDTYTQRNKDIQWLYDMFDALAPSIYVNQRSSDSHVGMANFHFMHAYMEEARRISDASPRKPIIAPFTKFEYDSYLPIEEQKYYTKFELCISLKMTADFGAKGAMMWSSDKTMNRERCHRMKVAVSHLLGPIVRLVRNRVEKCAQERCGGNGQCVRKAAWRIDEKCSFRMPPEEYKCDCDKDYSGDKCETKTS